MIDACWPHPRSAEVAVRVARAAGLGEHPPELVSFQANIADLRAAIGACGPALLALPEGLLAVVRTDGTQVWLLEPSLSMRRVPVDAVASRLAAAAAERPTPEVDAALAALAADPDDATGRAVRAALLADRAAGLGHLVRLPADAPIRSLAAEAGLGRLLGALLAVSAWQTTLGLTAWALGGAAALDGGLAPADVAVWTLLGLSLLPGGLASTWLRGELALRASALFRRRLVLGISRLSEAHRHAHGAGDALGRLLDADEVEALATSAGLSALTVGVDLALAAIVLTRGPAGILGGVGFASFVLLFFAATAWSFARARAARAAQLDATRGMIERMTGHLTRAVQEHPARWHDDDDDLLAALLRTQRDADRAELGAETIAGAGWTIAGLALLGPAVANAADPGVMAVGLAGTTLAGAALRTVADGAGELIAAWLAWERVAPLWRAAEDKPWPGDPGVAWHLSQPAPPGAPVVELHQVTFRHPGRAEAAIRDVSLTVRAGDRVLVQGPSGAGKSTLASLITGLRRPDSGSVLLRGIDLPGVGSHAWQRAVASAPQFHENHIFSESLLFNLLLGVGWPSEPEDEVRARAVCEALGLGPLLARMPAGLHQQVGETGWQLSHGERSRIFLARALLQGRELVVLDESFAALDPETLRDCLAAARALAPALVVIAHP